MEPNNIVPETKATIEDKVASAEDLGEVKTTEAVKPVSSAERIKTVDIVRGVALLGILLMNIPGFGIHWSVYPRIAEGPHNTADYYTLATIETF